MSNIDRMEIDEALDNLAQNIGHVHFADLVLLNVRVPTIKNVGGKAKPKERRSLGGGSVRGQLR